MVTSEENSTPKLVEFVGDKSQYGKRFWRIIIPGGNVAVNADEIRVNSCGALEVIGRHYRRNDDGTVNYELSRELPYVLMAFASGQWVSFYGASILSGEPVIADHAYGWSWT